MRKKISKWETDSSKRLLRHTNFCQDWPRRKRENKEWMNYFANRQNKEWKGRCSYKLKTKKEEITIEILTCVVNYHK